MAMRRNVDQRLGPGELGVGPFAADRLRGTDCRADELSLEPAGFVGSDTWEVADLNRPREKADLVQRADERRLPAHRLLNLHRGQGELRETLRKIVGRLVDVIGRAVVEQVPYHLDAGPFGGFERGQPARPIIFARRLLDQVPAKAIAHRVEAELPAQPIVLQHMLVVTGRPDQVESNAIPAPVRRAFEPRLEEAGERLVKKIAHVGNQCARMKIEPCRPRNWHGWSSLELDWSRQISGVIRTIRSPASPPSLPASRRIPRTARSGAGRPGPRPP